MPKSFQLGIAEDLSASYCSDSKLLQCLPLGQNECKKGMKAAVMSCDYRPLWNEFERKENAGSDYVFDQGVTEAIGKCVGDGFRKGTGVSGEQFDRCMEEYFLRFRARIRANIEGLEE
ncbi:MAG: hypothetical protein AB2795_19170 [Candidatus Thiodiazotropha endolucinida]